MSAPQSNRKAAETALWDALEDRRDAIRSAGLTFSERQHHQFRTAYHHGRLITELCGAMESYRPTGNEYYLRPMAEALRAGLPTWEDVLIRPVAPWSAFVTVGARRGAKQCIAEARAYIPLL